MSVKHFVCFLLFFIEKFTAFSQATNTKLSSFTLQQVRLKAGPFLNAQNVDLKYMLAMDVDRLLAPYRIDAGLPVKGERYGNWENSGLDGHIGGHYLSALSLMYASTNNPLLLKRLNYMIDELSLCQQTNGNGYVGGIPQGKIFWQRIAKGDLDGSGFGLNNTWVPLYNIHKLFAGLKDAYSIAGSKKAFSVLVALADWFESIIANLDDTQIQKMLKTEHGGLNEVFADIYELTNNKKYLTTAEKISHHAILEPLIEGKDMLTGLHANTQIPKVIGFNKIGNINHDTNWVRASANFWQNVTTKRSVSFGGNSTREHFNAINDFGAMLESNQGPENCNSYNMLKLTKSLFLGGVDVKFMDYFERVLFNNILSSQHPTKGGFVYFTPIRPRHYRVYSQPQQGFWCCVGTGLENHGKYGELIYAHTENNLYVNLFMASTLNWKEKGLTLTQSTEFPNEDNSTITLQLKKPTEFTIWIRYPKWVKENNFVVKVNGKNIMVNAKPSSYIPIKQNWKTDDKISLNFPMETTAEALPDGSPWVSFLHGPIVLAAKTDTTDLKGLFADDSRMGHVAAGKYYPLDEAPIIVSNKPNDYLNKIKPITNKPMSFSMGNIVYSKKYNGLQLIPFYKLHNARYMIYWPVMNAAELENKIKILKETERVKLVLEQQTIDYIAMGEQQPEVDHNFKGNKSNTGEEAGLFWRNTADWISFDLNNDTKKAKTLRITYGAENKVREFDILINDILIKSERLETLQQKTDVDYDLPISLIAQTKLTIKIAVKNGLNTGAIYGIRLLKAKE